MSGREREWEAGKEGGREGGRERLCAHFPSPFLKFRFPALLMNATGVRVASFLADRSTHTHSSMHTVIR